MVSAGLGLAISKRLAEALGGQASGGFNRRTPARKQRSRIYGQFRIGQRRDYPERQRARLDFGIGGLGLRDAQHTRDGEIVADEKLQDAEALLALRNEVVRTVGAGGLDDQVGAARGMAIAHGMDFAKDLGNLPSNICTPTYLGRQAQELAKQYALRCQVLEHNDMEKLRMGSLLAVTRGSREPGVARRRDRARRQRRGGRYLRARAPRPAIARRRDRRSAHAANAGRRPA